MTVPEGFKPMLAVSSDKVKTQPATQYCSEKLDGVRVVFFGGVAYSRSLKPLPNKVLQYLAAEYAYQLEGCDGETIVDEYKGDEDKVKSYYGFYTYYCFDSNKKFKSIGIYD